MNQLLADKLKTLPNCPGVYFHKDANGAVIYVGKASILKRRVMQYFNREHPDTKTRALVADIAMTDWIETDSEIDALFLENEMIKRYLPRYNILLRDNKNVCYVRINFSAEWPILTITRLPNGDDATYVGPFYSATPLKKALHCLRRVFPYLTSASEQGSALMQQLHLIPNSTSVDYKADLHMLVRYLQGDWSKITREVKAAMLDASKQLDFERAASLRNRLRALEELKRQIIFGRAEFMDISKDKALTGAQQLFCLTEIPRRIEAYDISHQGGQDVVGSMVVFTNGVADKQSYRKFKISKQRNDDYAAMDEVMQRRFSSRHKNWPRPDLIVVDGGGPQVRAVAPLVDDIPLIGLAKENDLIIVSATDSHINTEVITSLIQQPLAGVDVTLEGGYYQINLHAGMLHTAGHSFTFRGHNIVNRYTDLLQLIQRLRDESHRFAVAYHEIVKRQRGVSSILNDIPGVGPKRRQLLLRHFGSVKAIAGAPEAELTNLVGAKLALTIRSKLQNNSDML